MHDKVGPALRQARLARGLGLRELAGAAGISASQLSQIETGKSQPSVSTLYALVTRLDASLDELLGIDRGRAGSPGSASRRDGTRQSPGVVQRGADNPVLEMANGVRWERLAVGPAADVDVLLVTYEPGAASSADRTLMRHQGTEYGYLFSGELTLLLDFDRYTIGAGDSLCFDSTRPHMYVNQSAEPARGLWFVAGGRGPDRMRDWVTEQLGAAVSEASPRLENAVDVLNLLAAARHGHTGPGGETVQVQDTSRD
ncbi:cupin domain-containing protein [Nocardia yamanashiensis]|uniref:cupin domain-containing protein n=1 Tax=Nocardia yamanashiensis TaxID=209247 RepID=UPI001E42EEEA|nr:cupin domain-containing protein [Nocardia yamanashiensis]UGT44102.1 cupin domain-containing protein [Nocardia yamanashiensis]